MDRRPEGARQPYTLLKSGPSTTNAKPIVFAKHEIRYYHPEDADAAKALQTQVNDALKQLNYSVQIDEPGKQWLRYPQKPKQGVIELWLALPPRAATY
jgi:hypothetical protein